MSQCGPRGHGRSRIRLAVRDGELDVVVLAEQTLEALTERAPVSPEPDRLSDDDPVEPGGETSRVREAVATAPRPFEARLDRVLRVDRVATDQPGEADQPRVVGCHELGDVALECLVASSDTEADLVAAHACGTSSEPITDTDRAGGAAGSMFARPQRILTRRTAHQGLYLQRSGEDVRMHGQGPEGLDMRKLGLVAIAALMGAVMSVPVVDAASSSPVEGSWTSIDPVDGSTQHLSIQGGKNLQLQYIDELGTTCVDIGAPTPVFTGMLVGTFSDNGLVARFNSGRCGSRLVLRAADGFAWFFEYDPNTDTLWGAINDGPATWYRD